jgi:acetyl/propionyl-CoA carboxylase alpha subunit
MTTFQFSNAPAVRHRVHARADGVQVDDVRLSVRAAGHGSFVAAVDGRSERLRAVAHGDAVYVQLRGRAWRLDRVDPARSSGAAVAGAAGASLAPMPGVVVSVHAAVGQAVRQGDPLLVIESMKLQMTVGAAADGVVMELPFAVGQTFQRGAVLVRTAAAGDAQ